LRQRYSFAWAYTKGQAAAVVERHSVGAEVEVFYNPHDPSESVLERSTSGVVAPFVFGGLFFLAVGIGGIFLDYPALLERLGFE